MGATQWSLGSIVSGFELVEITTLEDYKATGYLFRHIATKMEVYQVVNDDTELFFGYVFRTTPSNDYGIAHILEHSVLAGSKKYPVRDPFMTLLKGSTNTYMNAMTYPDKTLYPAASPLREDFENLFSVYSDAVFAPLLREETFQQEGVRLVCDEDSCHFEGVVYNEMLGDGGDHDSIVGRQSVRALFPDTLYSYESGGIPEEIIKLDYQQFLSFYGKFYHPSNCRLFLYGKLEVGEKLEYLDNEYLRTSGMIKVDEIPPCAQSWSAPRKSTFTSPVEEGEGEENSSVVLSWATSEISDPLEIVTLSTLVDILLGNPGSPLYKALLDTKLGLDVSPESGMSADFRQMPFVVGFKGIKQEKADEAEACILAEIKKLVTKGIDREVIDACMKRARFKLQEIPGGVPLGIRALLRSLRGWMMGLSPSSSIGISKPLEALENALKEDSRYFENWMQIHLLDNPHRCLVTVVPDKEHQKRQLSAIAKYAKQQYDALGKKGLKTLAEQNAHFLQFEQDGDTPETLATVPRLHLEDLPKEIKTNTYEHLMLSGRDLFFRPLFCNGIVYIDLAIQLEDLSERELMLMPLYLRLVQMTGLGDLTYPQVANILRHLTGDFSMYLESGSSLDGSFDRIMVLSRTKTLVEDFPEAMKFIGNLLQNANVGDQERITAALSDLKTDYVDNVTYNAHSFAALAAASVMNTVQHEGEVLSGLHQWFFLRTITDDQIPSLAEELLSLQKVLSNRNRYSLHLTCDEQYYKKLTKTLEKFLEKFPEGEVPVPRKRTYGDVVESEPHSVALYRLPSTVSYCAYVMKSSPCGSALQAAQVLLGQILSGNELWEVVRGQGGAYGVSAHADVTEQLFLFTSYRDPRIAGTLSDFKKVLETYTDKEIDWKHIENALISTVGEDLKPLSPSQEAILSFRRILYNITDEFRSKRRTQLLSITAQDLNEGAKALIENAGEKDSFVALAGGQLISTEKDKNPILDRPSVRLPL
ncbi:putative Zn-dependent peptidase, insulinase [Sphaerochaeta pleomorpha str. Grapes]|uniref:Putative Zn-dependent peptidase, insulinase n=1 Tax=Sphaerochaeta pleomorpha (strain ATCC BAA-1885 / DSM 22778 / Grapes) TaxID=158190 RepID=G8QU08_SPHPG|nr:insulinase family protein [Sphaerochaeta pleomorpha]AEV30255.1 putative Zn-dependent peptidase, insulinase [Sphaerochaeta pleomorpha str. Grapes]